jgi:hypothetical protein
MNVSNEKAFFKRSSAGVLREAELVQIDKQVVNSIEKSPLSKRALRPAELRSTQLAGPSTQHPSHIIMGHVSDNTHSSAEPNKEMAVVVTKHYASQQQLRRLSLHTNTH